MTQHIKDGIKGGSVRGGIGDKVQFFFFYCGPSGRLASASPLQVAVQVLLVVFSCSKDVDLAGCWLPCMHVLVAKENAAHTGQRNPAVVAINQAFSISNKLLM